MSFDQLMNRLVEETRKQPDPDYMNNVYSSINMNNYSMALRDVLIERKETIRANLDPTLFFPPNVVYGMSDILKSNLENPNLHMTDDERKDEEMLDMERRYQLNVKQLKNRLERNLAYVDERSERHQKKMKDVLDEQMKFRPIDQLDLDRAAATLKYSHDRIRNETKEIATNSIMVMMNQVNDARKRRRNFTKDAIDRLQLFFESNKYPTEAEKEALAIECDITVQQVGAADQRTSLFRLKITGTAIRCSSAVAIPDIRAIFILAGFVSYLGTSLRYKRIREKQPNVFQVSNWFGNRRIRLKRVFSKKDQYDGETRSVFNPDGSMAYISSSKDYRMGDPTADDIASSSADGLDVLDISSYTRATDYLNPAETKPM